MKEFAAFLRRIDQRCARLNSGLAAVAIVLAVVVSAEFTVYATSAIVTVLQSPELTAAAYASSSD